MNKEKPEIQVPNETDVESPASREKEMPKTSESEKYPPAIEKSIPKVPRAEVQNPLMHESY